MNKIKGYRVMCGLTQGEMGRLMGMSRRTYVEREKDHKFTTEQANKFVEVVNQKMPDIKYDDIFLG